MTIGTDLSIAAPTARRCHNIPAVEPSGLAGGSGGRAAASAPGSRNRTGQRPSPEPTNSTRAQGQLGTGLRLPPPDHNAGLPVRRSNSHGLEATGRLEGCEKGGEAHTAPGLCVSLALAGLGAVWDHFSFYQSFRGDQLNTRGRRTYDSPPPRRQKHGQRAGNRPTRERLFYVSDMAVFDA